MQRMKRDLCQTFIYVTRAAQKRQPTESQMPNLRESIGLRAAHRSREFAKSTVKILQPRTRSAGSEYPFSHTSMTQGRTNTCESCPASFFSLKNYYDADIDNADQHRAA